MTDDDARETVEIPHPASTCEVCSRPSMPVEELSLRSMKALYTDSHEGAALERCELCSTIYLRAWLEVYDEIWRYYSPLTEEEAAGLIAAFQGPRHDREQRAWQLVKGRPALQKFPGSGNVAWYQRPLLVGGPSYPV